MRPIYATNGEWEAMLIEERFYNLSGEWIAWLDGGDIYSQYGEYVGFLSADGRILRKRVHTPRPVRTPPPSPGRIKPPSKAALAPTFGELPWDLVDIFEEDPEVFHRVHRQRKVQE